MPPACMNRQRDFLSTARPTDRRWLEPILHMGKETTAPHDRKTQQQRTIDWTKNILIFSTFHQQSD